MTTVGTELAVPLASIEASAPSDAFVTGAVPERTRSKARLLAVLAGLYLSLFIAALDQTILATAIPTISSQLHSATGYTWIGGGYLLANAAAGPIWAALSDIWGRKPILLAAVTIFFASSILCSLSNTMKMLIIGRAFQGVAGGGLIPLCMITISDLFSVRERSLYIGLTEFMWAAAGGVGPILGGTFTELLSWRWAFWINLPISGLTFLLLLLFLDVHNPRTPVLDGVKAIDWLGSASILGLVLMLLLGLDFGGAIFPWNSPKVICLIVFGALMSLFFIYSEKRIARYPLIPFSVIGRRSCVVALLVCFFHGFTFIASEYYMPLYLQSSKGLSPLHSGLAILPVTLSEALMGIFVGFFIHRSGRYLELIWIGTAIMAIGNGLFISLRATTGIGLIIFYEIVAGTGAGLLFETPLIALQVLVSQRDTAAATATIGFVRSIATSMSLIIGGVVFQNGMQTQVSSLRAMGLPKNITEALTGSTAAANVYLVQTLQDPEQRAAVKDAFAWSLRNMWILYTCVGVLSVVAGVFIKKSELAKHHTETRTGLDREKDVELATRRVVNEQAAVPEVSTAARGSQQLQTNVNPSQTREDAVEVEDRPEDGSVSAGRTS